MNRSRHSIILAILTLFLASSASAQSDPEQGVFQYVLLASADVQDVSASLAMGAEKEGLTVLSSHLSRVPKKCPYEANVLTVFNPAYAAQLMEANPITAPFAIVDRINVFEDESGVHVSTVNSKSILRTILLDDPEHVDLAIDHDHQLRELITASAAGEPSTEQYGMTRTKGYIGKTMGVMAGGPFDKKIGTIAVIPGARWEDVAADIATRMSAPEPEWGLQVVFSAALPKYEVAILGITGDTMESRSFSIVKAGKDKSRKKMSCPGLAHAGAYPLELVVRQDGDDVSVRMIGAMFRMKMYFEDAGKWAFMKNIGMPGSIAFEIEDNALERAGTN